MDVLNIFDMLVLFCGIYMAINGILMKTQNKINASLVLGKNVKEAELRDKEGFIAYMWWKVLAIGIVCALAGATNLILSKIDGMAIITTILDIVFFAILVVYGIIISKAQKKFM